MGRLILDKKLSIVSFHLRFDYSSLARDFKNGIEKRVGNEFFIRLNRLDYAFPNAFDHWFSNVLNGPVIDIVFLRHLNVSKIKNIRFPEKELRRE